MVTINVYLDCRRLLADGSAPVRISLTEGMKVRYVSTGVGVPVDAWDKNLRRVKDDYGMSRELNLRIADKRMEVERRLLRFELDEGRAPSLAEAVALANPDRAKRVAERVAARTNVVAAVRRYAEMKTERGTRASYIQTANLLEAFRPEATLDDITRAWLVEWDAWMPAPSPNTHAIHMRNLRAVFNFCIDEGVTTNYPFRRYKIRTVKTAKRNLPVEDLRRLFGMEVDDWQRPYRDFFVLTFLLIGINAKDLLGLRHSDLADGRIVYNRAKTKRLYSVKVEPEALALLERYRGRDWLVGFEEDSRSSDYRNWLYKCDNALQRLGTRRVRRGVRAEGEVLWPRLTTYWARHSWATIAASLDVPKETIAAALGHGGGSVTDIYIEFDRGKVDEANRRVIDWVLYGKK